MRYQPELSDAEWALIVELLENERRELPPEIRHTDTIAVHDALQQRMAMIDSLLQRLHRGVVETA